jgi:hypothetical protein
VLSPCFSLTDGCHGGDVNSVPIVAPQADMLRGCTAFSSMRYHRAMPREGSLVLSDVRAPTLTIICELCGRRWRYNVERLMAKHGDAKLTLLLQTLADCPRARVASIYDRCRAVYEGLAVR